MRTRVKETVLLLVLLLPFISAGCSSNLGAAAEQLQPFWPETYSYTASVAETWDAVERVVDLHISQHGRVLVMDSDRRVATWVEELEVGPEVRRRKKKEAGESAIVSLRRSEANEVGDGGVAITTVMVSQFGEGSRMRLRRSYYGRLTRPVMVHSRGEFAHCFHDLMNRELSAKGFAYVAY